MSEPSKARAKLTLRDLEAIQVPENVAPLTPRRATGQVEAVGDTPRSRLDPSSYLPEGVSPEVAALLGKPAREAAERAALEREEQEKARLEAERLRVEAERAAAERERIALEAAIAEAQVRQAALDAAQERKVRLAINAFALLVVALAAITIVLLNRPPVLDVTGYTMAEVARTTSVDRQVELGFQPIPEPVVVQAPSSTESGRTSGRTQSVRPRPSVRRNDLF
jgi:hypothetical protein